MQQLDPDEVKHLFDTFRKVMGITGDGWWAAIFEFSAFMGAKVLDETSSPCPYLSNPDVISKTRQYNGPHGETLLKAYKVKRYSLRGRVVTPIRKARHSLKLARAILHA